MQPLSVYAVLTRAVTSHAIPPVADVHYCNHGVYPLHTVTTVTYTSLEWWPESVDGHASPVMAQCSIVHHLADDSITIEHLEEW